MESFPERDSNPPHSYCALSIYALYTGSPVPLCSSLWLGINLIEYIYHIVRHLDWFHNLATMHTVAINIGEQMSVLFVDLEFWGGGGGRKYPGVVLYGSGLYGSSSSNVLRSFHSCFHRVWICFCPHQHLPRSPFFVSLLAGNHCFLNDCHSRGV